MSLASSAKVKTPPADPDYIYALSAVDQFLQAWEGRDFEAGLVMLTDAAKQQTSESQLEQFFAASGEGPRAFEIAHGQRLQPGRYDFAVALFDSSAKKAPSRSSHIVVIREGKNEWVVDRLP